MNHFANVPNLSWLRFGKKGAFCTFLGFFPIFVSACATQESAAPQPEVWEEKFQFTGWQDPGEPYPKEGYIFREWWLNGKKVSDKLAFIVWDVNRDDLPDMSERYDDSGKATEREYDFNFDGKPDKLETLK